MNLPKRILVPIDFSEFSEHALDFAVELAGKLDATIHLIHAISIPAIGVPELGAAWSPTMIDDLVASGTKAMTQLADNRRKVARIGEAVVQLGDPRDLILKAAADLHADLIVMGTHGRRGIRRALLGSVAEAVVRTAPCPVMTIRGAAS
jgi:glycine betaine transporter